MVFSEPWERVVQPPKEVMTHRLKTSGLDCCLSSEDSRSNLLILEAPSRGMWCSGPPDILQRPSVCTKQLIS